MRVIVYPPPEQFGDFGCEPCRVGTGGAENNSGDASQEGLVESFGKGLVETAASEAKRLAELRGPEAVNATTLLVTRPPLMQDSQDFLDMVDAVNDAVDQDKLLGTVQVGRAIDYPLLCMSMKSRL